MSLLCGLGDLGADRRRDGQCIYNRNKGLNGKRTDDVGIASGASNELKGILGLQRTVNLSEVPSHRGHYRNKNCHNGHAKYNHMHHIDAGQTLHAALKCQQDHGRNGDGHGNLAADAQQGLKQIGDDDRLCADRTGKRYEDHDRHTDGYPLAEQLSKDFPQGGTAIFIADGAINGDIGTGQRPADDIAVEGPLIGDIMLNNCR